jgi:hypothetical protein
LGDGEAIVECKDDLAPNVIVLVLAVGLLPNVAALMPGLMTDVSSKGVESPFGFVGRPGDQISPFFAANKNLGLSSSSPPPSSAVT